MIIKIKIKLKVNTNTIDLKVCKNNKKIIKIQ